MIQREGTFKITSQEINKYKEARLMTKFDYVTSLPDIFYDNHLAILPTKRGEYIIGHFDAYQNLNTTDKTLLKKRKEIAYPEWIKTIDPAKITSESTIMNIALASGMLQDLFNEDKIIQTVSGRMSSQHFSFNIQNLLNVEGKRGKKSKNKIILPENFQVDVNNSQVEIDGGFETPDKLILFEVKNNMTSNFLIRQLYYPYQLWARQLRKEVIPVFLQYANDTFNFSIFNFDDIHDYNSLRLVNRYNYIFGTKNITIDDLVKIFKSSQIVRENKFLPSPQANTMARVTGVIESISKSKCFLQNGERYITSEKLTLENDFVLRQAHYYASAAMYLDFVDQLDDGIYVLTKLGKEYLQMTRRNKNLLLAEKILEHRPYYEIFRLSLERRKAYNQSETYQYLKDKSYYIPELGESTRKRRSGTVAAWVRYLFDLAVDKD